MTVTRKIVVSLMTVLMFGGGCAPRMSQLLAHRHYREAICGANDRIGERRRERVSDALAADSETYVHVHRVDVFELAELVGDPALAVEVLGRVDLVKISVRANTLPIDALELDVNVQGEDMGAAAAPMGWETLAVATGERVPAPQRVVSYVTIGNFLRGLGVVATGGLSLPFTNFQGRSRLVPASSQDYARQMPRAARLLAALEPARCSSDLPRGSAPGAGQLCAGYFVFDRSPATQWLLTLAQTYAVTREVADDETCSHVRTTSVVIGGADAWPASFGPRMRGLAELPGRAVALRWQRG